MTSRSFSCGKALIDKPLYPVISSAATIELMIASSVAYADADSKGSMKLLLKD